MACCSYYSPVKSLLFISNRIFINERMVWMQNAPYAVVEASMMGVPYVTFDIGGTSELIQMETAHGMRT